ncbi:MAG: histidinol-phosphate aminotransferase family protein [Acidobacteriota bacterium]|nr:histidinol-phosphate aminotransferase family protein [Acidobacteriota bacterium]
MHYQRVPEAGDGLRLHLNENTGGCSPAVLAALRSLTAEDIAFYPGYGDVERETAAHLGVESSWLALVNGLDEGLHSVSALALRPDPEGPRRSIIPQPAFEMYAACTQAAGGVAVRIPPRAGFAFPIDEIRSAIDSRTRLLYLTNPNNPTGVAVPAATIAALAGEAPHVTVLVDEAYIDFGGESVLAYLDAHRNIIAGRTFAKAYGLAALRVGCLVAHPDALAAIRTALPPYNINVAAAVALRAALADRAWRDDYVRQTIESRRLLYDVCERRGLEYYRSEANFVLIRPGGRVADVVRQLAARGIIVRDRSTQPGCDGCMRITAGVVEHTMRCVSALEEIL